MRLGGDLKRLGGDLPRGPPRKGDLLGERLEPNPPLGGDQPRPPRLSPIRGRGPNPPLSLLGGLSLRDGGF